MFILFEMLNILQNYLYPDYYQTSVMILSCYIRNFSYDFILLYSQLLSLAYLNLILHA